VGRVTEAGRRSSRVLLLTDFNSRIPVMVEPSRDQAILAGNNTSRPALVFLPLNPRLAVGDAVVTSGRGGVLPPGLEVGRVRSIDAAGVAVEPLVDFARLEYLRLLEYTNVLSPERLEELQQEIHGPPLPPCFTPIEVPSPAEPVGGLAEPPAPVSGSAP
jgi:rod shape-determining protein MreC